MPINLHYQEYGPTYASGLPIIVVHDDFSSISDWSPIVERLAERFKVISVDLRNLGDSPHADTMTYQEMADDLKQLMETLSFEKASFIGHGMGGKAIMTLALLHPEYFRHLIVVDTAPATYPDDQSPKLDAMEQLDLAKITDEDAADNALQELVPDQSERKQLLENLHAENGSYQWRINLTALKQSMNDINGFPSDLPAAAEDYPTLFILGEDSEYFLPEHAKAAKAYFPKSQMVDFSNSGHNVYLEKMTQVTDMLDDYISRA